MVVGGAHSGAEKVRIVDVKMFTIFFVTINYKGKMLGMLEAEYGIQLLYVKDVDRFFVI